MKRFMSWMLLVLGVVVMPVFAQEAQGANALPTDWTTMDIGGWATIAITALVAVVAAAMGGYVMFLLVKRAMRWLGTALGGR